MQARISLGAKRDPAPTRPSSPANDTRGESLVVSDACTVLRNFSQGPLTLAYILLIRAQRGQHRVWGPERDTGGLSMSVGSQDATVGGLAFSENSETAPLCVQTLIRSHHKSLIHFLRQRLRVPEDAFDVAQETYVRMMQYEHSTGLRSPASMLFRIAINVANDLGRTERARSAANQYRVEDLDLVSDLPSPERELEGKQDLEVLYEAIEHLPPKCRQAFLLSRVQRMTYPQIASHCGISVKMVEKHISHALAICTQKVGGGRRHTSE